jgi:hypothetical protein
MAEVVRPRAAAVGGVQGLAADAECLLSGGLGIRMVAA